MIRPQLKIYYLLRLIFLLNFYRVNALSLNSLISQISTFYDINFRISAQTRASNFTSNFQPTVIISPITISYHNFQNNVIQQDQDRGVQTEDFFHAPPKRLALQMITIFLAFTQHMNDLTNVIFKSGHSYGNNFNILFYNVAHLRSSLSQEIFQKGLDVPKLGFTCPLTFITLTSLDMGIILFAHQLCYLCPENDRLIKFKKLKVVQELPLMVWLHGKLSSNAFRAKILFHQGRDYFATEEKIRGNSRLANCQKYFDSEPGCLVSYPLYEIVKARLNASMEGEDWHFAFTSFFAEGMRK